MQIKSFRNRNISALFSNSKKERLKIKVKWIKRWINFIWKGNCLGCIECLEFIIFFNVRIFPSFFHTILKFSFNIILVLIFNPFLSSLKDSPTQLKLWYNHFDCGRADAKLFSDFSIRFFMCFDGLNQPHSLFEADLLVLSGLI